MIKDSRLCVFHRRASASHDLTTPEGRRAAVIEASGPVAEWSDMDGICEQWQDPTTDKAYLERLWLNRRVKASEKAFDTELWNSLVIPDFKIPAGDTITLGFDGARWRDSVALIGTHLETGFQFLLGLWAKPLNRSEWEAPEKEIDKTVDDAFHTWNVWRMYCDPPYGETQVAIWAGRYGETKVVAWYTDRRKAMAYAIQAFETAMKAKEISHDGNKDYASHIGNSVRRILNMVDDNGKPLWLIYKERADSPLKIDAAVAGILSWKARCDALALGVDPKGNRDISEEILKDDRGM